MKVLYLLVGLVSGVLAFWFNAYNETIVWGVDQKLILVIGSLVSAFFARYLGKEHTMNTAAFVSIGIMSAFLLRVIYDTNFIDKSHHNLLPISFMFYTLFAIPSAYLGSFIAQWIEPKKQKT